MVSSVEELYFEHLLMEGAATSAGFFRSIVCCSEGRLLAALVFTEGRLGAYGIFMPPHLVCLHALLVHGVGAQDSLAPIDFSQVAPARYSMCSNHPGCTCASACSASTLWVVLILVPAYAGGILFKVYVIGEEVNVVKRLSLPDMEDGKEGDDLGVRSFSRVSSAAASLNEAGFEAVSKTAGKRPIFWLNC
jgi:hypothetical protein